VVRMVTGDNVETACFVAVKAGILPPTWGAEGKGCLEGGVDRDGLVLDGPTFNKLIRTKPDGPVAYCALVLLDCCVALRAPSF